MRPHVANVPESPAFPPPLEHIRLRRVRLCRAKAYLVGMTRLKTAFLAAAGLALAAGLPVQAQIQAQAPSASAFGVDAAQGGSSATALVGRTVHGRGGVVLGAVERVTLRRDGSPAEVLVRPKGPRAGGPRSLAYSSLRVEGEALSTPLTMAEFNAMPAVEVNAK
ncbi:MAG: hypothetical protein K0Q62_168 [Phenylobacterium sp.]|nr:hypothetical protein [Phenylobacterium sp.]